MKAWGEAELQEFALRTIVARRCQRAYLHDLRGGLQAMTTSFELLTRVATTSPFKPELFAKSTQYFKRAGDAHERLLEKSLEDICGFSDESASVDLHTIAADVGKFLQNDALARDIRLTMSGATAVPVAANRANLRLILLSMLTQGIDQSVSGSTLTLCVQESPRPGIDVGGITGEPQRGLANLLLPVARRWLARDGATIEPTTAADQSTGWSLRW